jgi:purine-binding chemotaxis protein CheW
MDILAARKKAAEQAKAKAQPRQPEPEPERIPEIKPVPAEKPALSAAPAQEMIASESLAHASDTAITPISAEVERVPEGDAPAEEIELLSFRLGGEGYAIMVNDVREVLKNYQLTVVPNAPAHILGVMSLRGTVTTVIDLCGRLGITPGMRDEKSRIIIVSTDDEDMGLLVDRVTGVVKIVPQDIKPAPENNEQGAEFLLGIARKNDRLHILLDLARVTGA